MKVVGECDERVDGDADGEDVGDGVGDGVGACDGGCGVESVEWSKKLTY